MTKARDLADVGNFDFPASDGSAGQVLQTDGSGNLSFADSASALTEVDLWRLAADKGSDGDISANLERADSSVDTYIGTGMSESSGVFTFPSTGKWKVTATFAIDVAGTNDDTVVAYVKVTENNSVYTTRAFTYIGGADGRDNSSTTTVVIDVTDTSQIKVKFSVASISSGTEIKGGTTQNITHFVFEKMGET